MKLVAALLFVSALSAQTPPKLRLPSDVRPLRYDLDLRLDPAQDTYTGRIAIQSTVVRSTPVVWLHSTGLTIRAARIGTRTARVIDGGRDFIGLSTDRPLPTGDTRIELEFSGPLNTVDVEGLFKQVDGGDAYIFTQFEATSARRAFPCFDEPSWKTPWRITLRVPRRLKAFANTPVASEAQDGDFKAVTFAESRPLPTYLVAMAVGPFDVTDAGRAGSKRIPVRTIALKGRGSEAAWVDRQTPRIIAALENYFGVPYPYEKLDQVTIPITVAFGAMENAGLITYRQSLLLDRPGHETVKFQRNAAGVITHELAHQWFGNMVTPAWWDDIWLNEAFATWITHRIVNDLYPEWNEPASAAERKADAMKLDALLSARRIRQPIEESGDIGNAFDPITYQKGAAVIRMFENYLGEDRFRRGVQAYMKKHAWGNATASDFLAAIGSGAGQNVAPAFSTFLDRGGIPLITAELKCDGKPRLGLTQERSLPIGSKGSRAEYWSVPVCFRYEAGGKVSRRCVVLSDPKDEVALPSCPAWVQMDENAAGYYQVLYKGEAASKLASHASGFSLAEKVDLLLNARALVQAGRMPVADAMSLAREFRGTPERQLVKAQMEVVASIQKLVPQQLLGAYSRLILESFGDQARQIGWHAKTDDSSDTRLLRPELLEFVAGTGGEPRLAAEARALAEKWLLDRNSVSPEVSGAVLSVAAMNGDRALYDKYVATARQTTDRRDRERIVDAIGSFRDPAIAQSALNLMLTGELDIRELTDLLTFFHAWPTTDQLAWKFVEASYDKLLQRLPNRLGSGAGAILPTAAQSLCSAESHAEVESFFRERIRSVEGGARVLANVLERIQLCAARREAQAEEIQRFLSAR